jgi:23S rRNA pseudouridine1911/1915/1917 synthase
VVYEDDDLAVIDKPAGLVVHPAPGHWDDTLVNALVARGTTLAGGAEGRPGIVHRLDRETSGLIIVAKTEVAHRKLAAMIAAHKVARVYAALIWGHLDQDPLIIEAPIGRDLRDRKRMAILPAGRRARTDAFVVARLQSVDVVRLELHTGRTHQIRVHLESIGHPIVGDPVYAAGGWKRIGGQGRAEAKRLEALAPRQALHAALLAFRHPISGTPLQLTSPWPADLWPLLQAAAGPEALPGREEALRAMGFFRADG